MVGKDFAAAYIENTLKKLEIDTNYILPTLKQTPSSVVLFDTDGKRQIYCDLKDIQESSYPFDTSLLENVDLVAACNINYNRPLLHLAKKAGKLIATDVHVLSDIHDEYNREFMDYADILFLSDENINGDYKDFIMSLENAYGNDVIVLGRGDKGALMYVKAEERFYEFPAVSVGNVVNTVGAGDALCSSFVHFYAKGLKADEALMRAQIFASYKIGFDGVTKELIENGYSG